MNSESEATKLSPEAQRILSSIISLGTDLGDDVASFRCRPPGAHELYAFCELLAEAPAEEQLQSFLMRYPGFLMSLFGMNDGGDLALLPKPKIGAKYVADYAVVQVFQGGAVSFSLRSKRRTNRCSLPSFLRRVDCNRLSLKIDEWREWVNPNRMTFC